MTCYQIDKLASLIAEKVSASMDEALDTEAAAKFLGISSIALRARFRRGQVPGHKRFGRIYFSRKEITNYLLSD